MAVQESGPDHTDAPSETRQYPIDDLAPALKRRVDGDAYELAREILALEHLGHCHLVGLAADARSVYHHHKAQGTLIAVPIRRDGLADGGPGIASPRTDAQVEAWATNRRFAWLYPRYR